MYSDSIAFSLYAALAKEIEDGVNDIPRLKLHAGSEFFIAQRQRQLAAKLSKVCECPTPCATG
jgi:hypothetical protein